MRLLPLTATERAILTLALDNPALRTAPDVDAAIDRLGDKLNAATRQIEETASGLALTGPEKSGDNQGRTVPAVGRRGSRPDPGLVALPLAVERPHDAARPRSVQRLPPRERLVPGRPLPPAPRVAGLSSRPHRRRGADRGKRSPRPTSSSRSFSGTVGASTHGRNVYEVVIHFDAALAALIEESTHHPGQRVVRLGNGDLEYRVSLSHLEEVARWNRRLRRRRARRRAPRPRRPGLEHGRPRPRGAPPRRPARDDPRAGRPPAPAPGPPPLAEPAQADLKHAQHGDLAKGARLVPVPRRSDSFSRRGWRGMQATLTWVDLTAGDRDKMRRVLDLFKEPGTLDEMGLGSLRDALSDALFPGTSYIQTRLRYVLFVPWIYRRLEARRTRAADVEQTARRPRSISSGRWNRTRTAKESSAYGPVTPSYDCQAPSTGARSRGGTSLRSNRVRAGTTRTSTPSWMAAASRAAPTIRGGADQPAALGIRDCPIRRGAFPGKPRSH